MKKVASRVRETPSFRGRPAKRKLGHPRKSQYFLTNRDVFLGPKVRGYQKGPLGGAGNRKIPNYLRETLAGGQKLRKLNVFFASFSSHYGWTASLIYRKRSA